MAKPLYLDPEQFDAVQKDIINNGFRRGRNCVVSGCAGSGKSCIAMAIFVDLCQRGRCPVIVTKQRALVNTYMDELLFLRDGSAGAYVRQHHGEVLEWYSQNGVVNTFCKGVGCGVFDADCTDILVDEAQDFTRGEIDDILSYFPKRQSVHFFGDDNQQIYEGAFGQTGQVNMEMLTALAGEVGSRRAYRSTLYNNYRLPIPAARFVDRVEGPEGNLSAKCFGEGSEKPYLLNFRSMTDALGAVRDIIRVRKSNFRNYRAAVISYRCETCEQIFNAVDADPSICSARVRGALARGVSNYRNVLGPKTLEHGEFANANVIATTAFSAKGLQFDDVFVMVDDFARESWSKELLNVLHVALTRTQRGLYVCYVNGASSRPFAHVPNVLCNMKISA